MIVAGIDEAGRGPVIGPMVMCALACEKDSEAALKAAGVKDSKLVAPKLRNKLAEMLNETCTFHVEILSAKEITREMQNKISLNDVEGNCAAKCLAKLYEKKAFEVAYVDSPDPVPSTYSKRIARTFKRPDVKVICENKADFKYVVVGAASIIAKEIRENEVKRIQEIVGTDFGSGYPSDPVTKKFVLAHANDPKVKEFIRWEWSTVKSLKTAEKSQSKLFEF